MYNLALAILFLFVFLFGITIGSFLNVLIYRIPLKLNFVTGRSFCPNCKQQIKAYDLIPLFSFFFLQGKCRNCKAKISPRYPLIEGLCGVLFLLCFWHFGFTLQAVVACALACILIVISMIDFDSMIIPNGLIIALMVLCAVSFVYTGVNGIWGRVIGFFAVSVPFYILTLIIPGSFGGGDVKLMAVCGFLLGWQNVLLAAFIGFIFGGIAGCIIMAKNKNKDKKNLHMPLGPWLSIGVFIAFMYGQNIINWYISLL